MEDNGPREDTSNEDDTLDTILNNAKVARKPLLVVAVVWSALTLFSGYGLLFEAGLVFGMVRRHIHGAFLRLSRWALGFDAQEIIQSTPAWLPFDSVGAQKIVSGRLHNRFYALLASPFDRWIANTLQLLDQRDHKLGALYMPISVLPMFTLQSLMTLSAAATLIIPFSPGFLLNNTWIDIYLCICLLFMFADPIIRSRQFVDTFLIAEAHPILAGTLAAVAYLAALFLVALRFQPEASQIWQAQTIWAWFEVIGQTLAPSSISDWREMLSSLSTDFTKSNVRTLISFIPEVFATLLSIGALKIAGTVIFLKSKDDDYYKRGMHLLVSGKTDQAKHVFQQIKDDTTRTFSLMIPALIKNDEEDFKTRIRDYCEEMYAPFWSSQPEMMRIYCLHFLEALFNLNADRYPLALQLGLNEVHPALTLTMLTPIGGVTSESIENKINLICRFAQNEAGRDIANDFNPTRFPAGFFEWDNETDTAIFDWDQLAFVLQAKSEDNLPELDQLGAVIIAASILKSNDVGKHLNKEWQLGLRDSLVDCARALAETHLPLGREMEELLILTVLRRLSDELGLEDIQPPKYGTARKELDRIQIRNMTQGSEIKGQKL